MQIPLIVCFICAKSAFELSLAYPNNPKSALLLQRQFLGFSVE